MRIAWKKKTGAINNIQVCGRYMSLGREKDHLNALMKRRKKEGVSFSTGFYIIPWKIK